MTLRASLLRELENPSLSVDSRAERCCEIARELENKGEYEDARKVLTRYWRRIGEHPNVKGLERSIAGEVRITQAARSLGMSWQALAYALRTRHKDLLKERKPVRHRKPRR